jgi:hypothetical protein
MDPKSNKPEPSTDKPDQGTDKGLHIDTTAQNTSDGTAGMCDAAPDKEKCQEFVERLHEASNNIDRKS